MTVRPYSSPPAFKQALEQRLKAMSKDGVDFARRRELLVFDRFLARVSAVLGNSVLLKGDSYWSSGWNARGRPRTSIWI
jgi:hypothetical protein